MRRSVFAFVPEVGRTWFSMCRENASKAVRRARTSRFLGAGAPKRPFEQQRRGFGLLQLRRCDTQLGWQRGQLGGRSSDRRNELVEVVEILGYAPTDAPKRAAGRTSSNVDSSGKTNDSTSAYFPPQRVGHDLRGPTDKDDPGSFAGLDELGNAHRRVGAMHDFDQHIAKRPPAQRTVNSVRTDFPQFHGQTVVRRSDSQRSTAWPRFADIDMEH